MEVCVIYKPFNTKFLLKSFREGINLKLKILHKGEMYSLRNTSRIQDVEFVGQLQQRHNLQTSYFVGF